MAQEDRFEAEYPATNDQLIEIVCGIFPDSVAVTPDGRWRRSRDVDITVARYDDSHRDEDDAWYVEALGFRPGSGIDFRFRGTASLEQRAVAETAMFAAVLGFLDAYPGDAVLLHNGERVILERYAGVIALDAETMDDLLDDGDCPPLARLLRPHPRRLLRQPLL